MVKARGAGGGVWGSRGVEEGILQSPSEREYGQGTISTERVSPAGHTPQECLLANVLLLLPGPTTQGRKPDRVAGQWCCPKPGLGGHLSSCPHRLWLRDASKHAPVQAEEGHSHWFAGAALQSQGLRSSEDKVSTWHFLPAGPGPSHANRTCGGSVGGSSLPPTTHYQRSPMDGCYHRH